MNTKNLPEKEVQCKHGAKHYCVDLDHFLLPTPSAPDPMLICTLRIETLLFCCLCVFEI